MGIQVEFNPDLALRAFETKERKKEECLPKKLEVGKIYDFLKSGQRLFWLDEGPEWNCGEMPLCETKGGGVFSSPIASIKILETTHFLNEGKVWTKGKYKVIQIFDKNDKTAHFNGFKKIK
jgi:hypothetical protein